MRINYSRWKGHWILPGGFVESNEHPSQAVVREFFEETAQEVEVEKLIAVRDRLVKNKRDIYFVYQCSSLKRNALKCPASEIMEVRYWPVKEALAAPEVRPLTRMFVEMAMRGTGFLKQKLPSDHELDDEVFGI